MRLSPSPQPFALGTSPQFPHWKAGLRLFAGCCSLAVLLSGVPAAAQVITIDRNGNATTGPNGQAAPMDRRFAQVQPTHVPLEQKPLDARTRLELIRALQREQGFAMRPIPRGHKGLTLAANGKLEPAGEAYVTMVSNEGLSAKPGDRLVITDVLVQRSKIILQLNGGPDMKHRFLRHIELGTDPYFTYPIIQDDGTLPTGARLTLTFKDHVPELTGKQVMALLAPLISFEVKSPIQAFTDTLPPRLRQAILSHQVLVGMSTDMVLFAKGQPDNKTREMDGQMPFEEWIYGRPPKDVEFVRINGNRVIRVEIAKIGEKPVIFTKDEVEAMMSTDGSPIAPQGPSNVHTIELGDVQRDPNTQAPAPPPTLRNPGEKLPTDNTRTGVMRPVQFPKEKPDAQTGSNSGSQPAAAPSSGQTAPATPPANVQPPPADASESAPASPASGNAQPNDGPHTPD